MAFHRENVNQQFAGLSDGSQSVVGSDHYLPMDASQKTLLWQQNQYMADSGIHSGANTRSPSVSGQHLDGLEPIESNAVPVLLNLDANFSHSGYQQQEQNNDNGMMVQTPGMYQRHTLEPVMGNQVHDEFYPENTVIVQPPGMFQKEPHGLKPVAGNSVHIYQDAVIPSQPHKMIPPNQPLDMALMHDDPSQLLKNAICNLVNIQEYSDLEQSVIPEIINLLNDEDQVVVRKAATMAFELSKWKGTQAAMAHSRLMISALICKINKSTYVETLRCVTGCLHHLSYYQEALSAILDFNGVERIVNLLSSSQEAIQFNAITTLHNMLMQEDNSKKAIQQAGGIEKLINLLRSNYPKFLAITTDCLHFMCLGNPENKLLVLACRGPQELVRIMQTHTYEKLLWTTSRVLKVLSVCSTNKPAIIEAGAVSALTLHLSHNSQRLVQNCLLTLRNLSDAAVELENMGELLRKLVLLLNADVHTVTCVAGILSNLTCNNMINKMVVCQSHGVETLIKTMIRFPEKPDILEPVVCALRHLTGRHQGAQMAQNTVRMCAGGLHQLVSLLAPPSSWSLIKAVMELIRNLVILQANIEPLRECGIIDRIAEILKTSKYHQDVHKKQFNRYNPDINIGDGVRMSHILKAAIGTLVKMTQESQSLAIICAKNCIPLLVQLLYVPNESIQHLSLELLIKLIVDKREAEKLRREGAAELLSQLCLSPNETIVSFASDLLNRITEKWTLNIDPFRQDFMGGQYYDEQVSLMSPGPWKQMGSMDECGSRSAEEDYIATIQQSDSRPQMGRAGPMANRANFTVAGGQQPTISNPELKQANYGNNYGTPFYHDIRPDANFEIQDNALMEPQLPPQVMPAHVDRPGSSGRGSSRGSAWYRN